jgi:hypothetical protein
MRWLRDNSLSLFFFALLIGSLVGQAISGNEVYNDDAVAHDEPQIGFWRYVVSSHFGQAVLENWQSEYLQFTLFILATIWLYQKGSPESSEEPGRESDQRQKLGGYAPANAPRLAKRAGGLLRWLYSWSLLLVMAAIWIASWVGQSVTGWTEENNERAGHDEPTISWAQYLGSAQFWEDTLQNVSALSLWALVSGHWAAWQAARVEVAQQQEYERKQNEPPVEERVLKTLVEETELDPA